MVFGRPRHRWGDGNKKDLKERGRRGVEWVGLTHKGDRWWAAVNMAINFKMSQNAANILLAEKFLSSQEELHG